MGYLHSTLTLLPFFPLLRETHHVPQNMKTLRPLPAGSKMQRSTTPQCSTTSSHLHTRDGTAILACHCFTVPFPHGCYHACDIDDYCQASHRTHLEKCEGSSAPMEEKEHKRRAQRQTWRCSAMRSRTEHFSKQTESHLVRGQGSYRLT